LCFISRPFGSFLESNSCALRLEVMSPAAVQKHTHTHTHTHTLFNILALLWRACLRSNTTVILGICSPPHTQFPACCSCSLGLCVSEVFSHITISPLMQLSLHLSHSLPSVLFSCFSWTTKSFFHFVLCTFYFIVTHKVFWPDSSMALLKLHPRCPLT